MPRSPAGSAIPRNAPTPWSRRHALWLVLLVMILPNVIGSIVNIIYNSQYLQPVLSEEGLNTAFVRTFVAYNIVVYPIAIAVWAWLVLSLRRPFHQIEAGEEIAPDRLVRIQRGVINLPWWGGAIAGLGWLLCIPVFLLALRGALHQHPSLAWHLTNSFLIAGLIALTHGFFAVELMGNRLLYPVFFRDALPSRVPGALALTLRGRGLVWSISAGACPIVSLLMLFLTPREQVARTALDPIWFAAIVGIIGIAFGLVTAALIGRLVAEPVVALRVAAERVAEGDLSAHVPLLRADEFGPLIDSFNHMVDELRDKQRIRETFGLHVGEDIARKVLARDPELGGVEQEITVMFLDIRGFTERASRISADDAVALLNWFFNAMAAIVQDQGGVVNKFLGDGFMALFGLEETAGAGAQEAAEAAGRMLQQLERLNEERQWETPLRIGIGIHTGKAVVGSIGSPHRMEYTAIGDTVNLASRVEGLTKTVGSPVLITAATYAALKEQSSWEALPPQEVRGQPEKVRVYGLSGGFR